MRDHIESVVRTLAVRASEEDGQTMTEYAMLVVFIALVALVAVQLLGTNLLAFFNSAANAL